MLNDLCFLLLWWWYGICWTGFNSGFGFWTIGVGTNILKSFYLCWLVNPPVQNPHLVYVPALVPTKKNPFSKKLILRWLLGVVLAASIIIDVNDHDECPWKNLLVWPAPLALLGYYYLWWNWRETEIHLSFSLFIKYFPLYLLQKKNFLVFC